MTIVQIQNLSFDYLSTQKIATPVLRDISMSVYEGEILILKGHSGSGKTTLLTLIGALRTAQEGSIKVFNEELIKASPTTLVKVRKEIGFIFQAHNLLGYLTVRQNLQLSLQLQNRITPQDWNKEIEKILQTVGLAEQIDQFPESLSGGQKQRVAVARALIAKPRLVLADEPTAALDSKSGREVVTLMQKLARQRSTAIILVTHDDRILDIADRIITLEDGLLVAQEKKTEVF
jgi:putative ABC transport system ATP-binding protein